MTCDKNFEHAIFFEMSPEKILCKFLPRKNPQKELQTGSPNGCHWAPFLSDVSVLRCDIRCRVYINPGVWAPIFCKGTYPSIPPMIMLQRAIKSLKCITNGTVRGPPIHHTEVIDCCNCFTGAQILQINTNLLA